MNQWGSYSIPMYDRRRFLQALSALGLGTVSPARAQLFNRVKTFREEQRRARFEPVDARLDADGGGLQRLVNGGQIQGKLNDRMGQVAEVQRLCTHSAL